MTIKIVFIPLITLLLPTIYFYSQVAAESNWPIHVGCFNRVDINFNNITTGSVTPSSVYNVIRGIDNLVDLWFKPNSSKANSDPRKCAEACKHESFRYSGVYKLPSTSSDLQCHCGSSYGRNGPGICSNCTKPKNLFCGSETAFSIYDTDFKVPSPPQHITLLQRTENVLRISWIKPKAPNGHLRGYSISAIPMSTYSTIPLQPINWDIAETPLHHYLVGLTPGTKYNISIWAVNSQGKSMPAFSIISTKIGKPDEPPKPKILSEDKNKGTMSLSLSPGRNTKGPITAYRLILIDENITPYFNKDHIYTWNETNNIGYPYYLAAEFSPDYFPSKFTVGDGYNYGGYFNGKIPTGHWHPKLGMISSMDGFVESTYSATGHDQHSDDEETSESRNHNYRERYEIIDSDSSVVKFLWIAISVSAGILVLCFGVFVILKMNLLPSLRKRLRPNSNAERNKPSENHQLSVRAQSTPSFTLEEASGAYSHSCFIHDHNEDMKTLILTKLNTVWNIPRNFMSIPNADDDPQTFDSDPEPVKIISRGRYGPVYLSKLKSKNSLVSLYGLPLSAFYSGRDCSLQPESLEKLYTDLDNLIKLGSHENVVQLLGFAEDKEMLFAIEYGGIPLKSWLLEYRDSLSGRCSTNRHFSSITPYSLLVCAMNIAEGMYYLQTFKITHGQLAACNILLDNIEKPKITGFGILSQNPIKEQRDYSRWNAQELFQNRCVRPCDSWSFGILLWELASLGGTPYNDVRSEDLSMRITRGSRPNQIEAVMGEGLYQIMLNCWQIDRDERPDFDKISCSIHELLPHSAENLFILSSFKYPTYFHNYEYMNV